MGVKLASDMGSGSREAILAAAKLAAQAHGYGGLNFRDLATAVGIRAASIYHYFPSKADLGEAVARRYWEDTVVQLDGLRAETPEPLACLRRYKEVFRKALETGNRMCLCSFMGAEFDDLPEAVRVQVNIFADVNIAWLTEILSDADLAHGAEGESQAQAIFAAIAGAQLMARSRADISVYDALIESYRKAGLLPA